MPKIAKTQTKPVPEDYLALFPPELGVIVEELPDLLFSCIDGVAEVYSLAYNPPSLLGILQLPSAITCVSVGAKPYIIHIPEGEEFITFYHGDGSAYFGTDNEGVLALTLRDVYEYGITSQTYELLYPVWNDEWPLDTPLCSNYVVDISVSPLNIFKESYSVVTPLCIGCCTTTGTEYIDPIEGPIFTYETFYSYTDTEHGYKCFLTSSGLYYTVSSYLIDSPGFLNNHMSYVEPDVVPTHYFGDFIYFRILTLDTPCPEDNFTISFVWNNFPFSEAGTTTYYFYPYDFAIIDEYGNQLHWYFARTNPRVAGYHTYANENPEIYVKVKHSGTKKLYALYGLPEKRTSYFFGTNLPDDIFTLYEYFVTGSSLISQRLNEDVWTGTSFSASLNGLNLPGGATTPSYIKMINKTPIGRARVQLYARLDSVATSLLFWGWVDENNNPLFMRFRTSTSQGTYDLGVNTNPFLNRSWMMPGSNALVYRNSLNQEKVINIPTFERSLTSSYYIRDLLKASEGASFFQTWCPVGGAGNLAFDAPYNGSMDDFYEYTIPSDLAEKEGYFIIYHAWGFATYVQEVQISSYNNTTPFVYIGPEFYKAECFSSRLVAVYDTLESWNEESLVSSGVGYVYEEHFTRVEYINDIYINESTPHNLLTLGTNRGVVQIEENRNDHDSEKIKFYYADRDSLVDKYIVSDEVDFMFSNGTSATDVGEYNNSYEFDYNNRPPANRALDDRGVFKIHSGKYKSTYSAPLGKIDGVFWTLLMSGLSMSPVGYSHSVLWSNTSWATSPPYDAINENYNSSFPFYLKNLRRYDGYHSLPFTSLMIYAMRNEADPLTSGGIFNITSLCKTGLVDLIPKSWYLKTYSTQQSTVAEWKNALSTMHNIPDSVWPPEDTYYYRAGIITSYTKSISNVVSMTMEGFMHQYPGNNRAEYKGFPLFCRIGFFGFNPETNAGIAIGLGLGARTSFSNPSTLFSSGVVYATNVLSSSTYVQLPFHSWGLLAA